MTRVLIVGHVCVDLLPALVSEPSLEPGALVGVGPLAVQPGGCVANTGGDLIALGVPVRAAADLGDDALAELLSGLLEARGFDVSGFRRAGGSTSYSVVVQAPGRDRTFWHHVGANAGFTGRDVVIDGETVLHVGYPMLLPALAEEGGLPLAELLLRAREAGLLTSMDLAVVDAPDASTRRHWTAVLERALPLTDLITPSLDDLVTALGWPDEASESNVLAAAASLVERGAAIAVVSAGSRGLAIATAGAARFRSGGVRLAGLGEEWFDVRAFISSPPVDSPATTTGAGDAASAGVLTGLLRGLGPEETVRFGAAVAAAKVAGRPWDAELSG